MRREAGHEIPGALHAVIIRGFKRTQSLPGEVGEEVESVTIMPFDSLDAPRGSAGEIGKG